MASFAAADGFMPRQLTKRGHRLVFSNGALALAADGTGDVRVVFLGRRHIAGIVPGTFMSAHAVVGQRLGNLEMLNPAYTLLLPDRPGTRLS